MSDHYVTVAFRAIRALQKSLRPQAPARRMLVFLFIAEEEPVTLDEISRQLGIPAGTAYEDVRALGKKDVAGKEGSRLIMDLPSGPEEPAHRFIISPRGQIVLERVRWEMEVARLEAVETESLVAYEAALLSR